MDYKLEGSNIWSFGLHGHNKVAINVSKGCLCKDCKRSGEVLTQTQLDEIAEFISTKLNERNGEE